MCTYVQLLSILSNKAVGKSRS